MHACGIITTTHKDERHSSLEKYTSHFIERVVWERELGTEQNCNILTPTLLAITAFLSRSPGLLNRGPSLSGICSSFQHLPSICNSSTGGLRAHYAGCWLSLPHLVSNWSDLQTRLISNCSNFLCTELHNSSTFTFFLWASQIALIQPVHGQGYILIFFDWMHLLFTQVHFLFWQPGRVGGQYTTILLFSLEQKLFKRAFVELQTNILRIISILWSS